MSYYHNSKEEALNAGQAFAEYWDLKAELEPSNGWVLVLIPKTVEVFKYPLFDILQVAEIDLAGFPRLRKHPANRNPIVPPLPKREPGSSAPRTAGATGRVWMIADKMHEESPLLRSDRNRVIAACEAEGINKSTAATQWSKWAKARGI